jgi:tRNA A37 methylthiotransferase MiaB
MDSLIETYRNDKVYKFLHVPVQSGSDRILRSMRRNYKVSEFIRIVSNFRKVIPGINIITDVITGFPGETEEDFQKTVDLLKIIRPDVVNVSKFGARPGTEAEDMAQLDNRLIKTRSAELSGLVRRLALEKNREWVGWSGEILVSERGTGKNQWIGRNIAYKPVLMESRENLLGKRLNVRIEGAELTHLVGSITGPV